MPGTVFTAFVVNPRRVGGVEMFARELSLQLNAAGWKSVLCFSAAPPENVDLEMVTRIRDEAFNRSKAFETLSRLCDGIGPRVTGSPSYRRAAEWAKAG